jgi:uncharacterized protein YdaU (DUF1376 family)
MDSPLQILPPKCEDSMPFFGTLFFEAVEGHSDAVALGYIRALWHYWNHTHCRGLPNDDEYLLRICRCDPAQWAKVKGDIFDNVHFFTQNGDGTWHQKRAKDIYARETELYNRRKEWAKNARTHKADRNTIANASVSINPVLNVEKPATVSHTANMILREKELERVEAKIADIKRCGTLVAGDTMRYTVEQATAMRNLKARKADLLALLGFKA